MDLVGRDQELATVVGALAAASSRGLVGVLITGEAGIGKSALVAAAVAEAAASGATVLRGHADALDRRIPYAGLLRAVQPLAEDEREEVAESARDLVRLLVRVGEGDAASFGRVCGALASLLAGLVERAPVVLSIDDIDLLDDDALAALTVAARRLTATALAVVGSSRTEPTAGTSPLGLLVQALEGNRALERLRLVPLAEAALSTIAATFLGGAPDPDLGRELHRRADGNPFFAVEIARSLRDAGIVDATQPQGARLTSPIRLTRGDAVLQRLLPLETNSRVVLDVVAVLGRVGPGDIALVGEASGLDVRTAATVFDDFVARGILIVRGDSFTFAHDLVREAALDAIGPARRRLLHAAVAHHLTDARAAGRPIDLLTLAGHLSASAEPGDADAAAVLAEAGDRTRSVAPGTAAAHYARALELAPEASPARPTVLARRSRALSLAGRPAEAAAVGRDALAALVPGAERVRTANVVISALIEQGRLVDALEVADTESALAPGSPILAAQRASVLWNLQRFDEARAEATRADGLAASSAAERLLTLGPLGLLAAYAHVPRPLLELAEEMLRIGASLPTTLELYSTAITSYSLSTSGFFGRAADPLRRAERLMDEVGGTAFRAHVLVARILVDWMQGRWDEAVDAIPIATAEMGANDIAVQAAALEAIDIEIRSWRGEQLLDRLLRRRAPVPNFADLRAWAVAGGLSAAGRLADARTVLRDTEGRGRQEIAYRPIILARRIDIETAAGDHATAVALLTEIEDDVQAAGNPWAAVLCLRARALVTGDVAAALEAVAVADDEGHVFETARSQLLAGELSADATDLLDPAYRTFQALGADALRRRTGAILKGGAKVPRQRASTPGPLTEAERKIAKLVQQGMRNREIAVTLHYSPRTVEVYLSRIYAKLEVTSRLDLARTLDRWTKLGVNAGHPHEGITRSRLSGGPRRPRHAASTHRRRRSRT